MKGILNLHRTRYKQSHETWNIKIQDSDVMPKKGDKIRLGYNVHVVSPSKIGMQEGVPVYSAEVTAQVDNYSEDEIVADYGFHKSYTFRKLYIIQK